jgi:hypothetical protein
MESNSTAIMLLRWKPLIEEFKLWVVEARDAGVSDARMEGILSYIGTTAGPQIGPNVLEVMMHELREAAPSLIRGPKRSIAARSGAWNPSN